MAKLDARVVHFVSYATGFVLTTVVLVYILNFPAWLTGADALVREYYIQNGPFNFVLDFFLIAAYLWAASLPLARCRGNACSLLVVAGATFAISATLYLLFRFRVVPGATFFHRWFDAVGWKAALYDAVVVASVYVVYQKMLAKFAYHRLI